MADYQTGDYQSTVDYQSTMASVPTIDYSTFKLCPLRNVECARRHCAWWCEPAEGRALVRIARK